MKDVACNDMINRPGLNASQAKGPRPLAATLERLSFIWVAVTELEVNHLNEETPLFGTYPHHGNLN